MEKIQIITYEIDKLDNYNCYADINNFNSPNSLDNYDINIIDLSHNDMWINVNSGKISSSITLQEDFASIRTMIENSKKSKVLVCLPQNAIIHCSLYGEKNDYEIKNVLKTFYNILKGLLPIDEIKLFYENNKTKINELYGQSAFGFINGGNYNELTKSTSEKLTTISKDNLIITSINLIDNMNCPLLLNYLRMIGIIQEKEEIPDWVRKYIFFDDEQQMQNVEKSKEQIKKEKEKIEKANIILDKNLRYKSILYTNSDELVEVVFEILEDLFDISLKEFKDEKKEDFNFKKDGITYIGEIKGVTSNVKNEHISQLDEHYSKYLDVLQEEGKTESIRKLLIINYERNRDVNERNEIHIMQDEMAKKRDTLILDTLSLLKIYELFLSKKSNKKTIIEYINNTLGIAKPTDIKKAK